MWRSYYERRRMALFGQLTDLLRRQYWLTWTQSVLAAYHAGRAAVLFQDGRGRAEYEQALPDLRAFYAAIYGPGRSPERAARLELEWWIVHRERALRGRVALEQALAELQAEIYQVPAERFVEHARLRAEAMVLRDDAADNPDWRKIRGVLEASWRAHSSALLSRKNLRQATGMPLLAGVFAIEEGFY